MKKVSIVCLLSVLTGACVVYPDTYQDVYYADAESYAVAPYVAQTTYITTDGTTTYVTQPAQTNIVYVDEGPSYYAPTPVYFSYYHESRPAPHHAKPHHRTPAPKHHAKPNHGAPKHDVHGSPAKQPRTDKAHHKSHHR